MEEKNLIKNLKLQDEDAFKYLVENDYTLQNIYLPKTKDTTATTSSTFTIPSPLMSAVQSSKSEIVDESRTKPTIATTSNTLNIESLLISPAVLPEHISPKDPCK